MKFIKSDWAKKLIIVFVVLLLFNTLYPSMSHAIDLGGILMQPIWWYMLANMIPVDLAMGTIIRTMQFDIDDIDDYTEDIMQTKPNGWTGTLAAVETQLKKLFIGPDSIFRRRYKII